MNPKINLILYPYTRSLFSKVNKSGLQYIKLNHLAFLLPRMVWKIKFAIQTIVQVVCVRVISMNRVSHSVHKQVSPVLLSLTVLISNPKSWGNLTYFCLQWDNIYTTKIHNLFWKVGTLYLKPIVHFRFARLIAIEFT